MFSLDKGGGDFFLYIYIYIKLIKNSFHFIFSHDLNHIDMYTLFIVFMWPISTTSTCWKNSLKWHIYISTNCKFFNQIDKRCIHIMCDYTYLHFIFIF